MFSRKLLIKLIVIFSVVGLIASIYSVKTHYETGVTHEICSFNDTFSCDVVNQSEYSELFGIPVSILGIIGYVFFLISVLQYKNSKNENLMTMMSVAGLVGTAFSAYLTYIEAYVLYTWCIICIISAISMVIVTISTLSLRNVDSKPAEFKHE